MSGRLIALDLEPGPRFVNRLRQAWDDGDAILPVDQRLPDAGKAALYRQLRPHVVADAQRDRRWRSADRLAPIEVGVDDAAVIATSGTTGTPKGVVLTHRAIAASAAASTTRLGVTRADHWLACLPLSHVGGLSVVFRAMLTDTALTVLDRFAPAAVLAAARQGANLVSLVPTALGRIDPGAFDTILLGGAKMPDDLPDNVVTTYGMTETGSGVVYDRFALDGVELRCVDGELQVRGPMLFRCYRGGDPFESSPLDAHGWFATGDIGEIAADGMVSVLGRRAEMIITGGENVWPTAVESAIDTLDGVADVIVVGADDDEWGQIVTAHVVAAPDSDVTIEAVRDAVKARLPSFCAPKVLVFHDRLPRTTLGKPQRHLLAAGSGFETTGGNG